MKTILSIVLASVIAVSGFGQDNKCSCVKKTAHHKIIHKRAHLNSRAGCSTAAVVTPAAKSVVFNCPSNFDKNSPCIFDSLGNVSTIIERSYTGNYPAEVNPDVNENLGMGARELVVTSSAFNNFGVIPAKYSCEGSKASPPLSIGNIPAGTQSMAIIMYDTHATPQGGSTNWMIWDIDSTGSIPENFVNDHVAMNAAKEYGYQAVCPMGGTHYYHFMVYALDTKLLGSKHTSRASLESAMKGHILAKGELVGAYNKHLD